MISSEKQLSFFEAFALVVRKSGLSHAEIARRANEQVRKMIAAIPEPTERMLAEIAMRKLHRATISRAVKGESSISEQTLLRISLGLQLDEDTYRWLEDLRKEEPYVNHSSQTPAIINPDGEQLPSWMFNN